MPATFRRAAPEDAEAIARLVIDGFETYRAFTPPGWEPPGLETELDHLEQLLPDEQVWVLLAEDDGTLVGEVGILPSLRSAHPEPDASLAHFRNLFVTQDRWGSGLAVALHSAAIEEGQRRGFAQMRLFTPADHGRARRFYEREGWAQRAEPFDEPRLGMVIVEYRHALA